MLLLTFIDNRLIYIVFTTRRVNWLIVSCRLHGNVTINVVVIILTRCEF